jgi:hypothetical protein
VKYSWSPAGERSANLWRLGEDRIYCITWFRYEPVSNQSTDCDHQQDDDHHVDLLAGLRRHRCGSIDVNLSLQPFGRHLVHPREDQRRKETEHKQQNDDSTGELRNVEQRRQDVGQL